MTEKITYKDLSFWLKVVVIYSFINLGILGIAFLLILIGVVWTIIS